MSFGTLVDVVQSATLLAIAFYLVRDARRLRRFREWDRELRGEKICGHRGPCNCAMYAEADRRREGNASHGDDTPRWMCEPCRDARADDA